MSDSTCEKCEKLEVFRQQSLQMNAKLPTDVWLKGNGEIWITKHGNDGVNPRKATHEEVIKYLWLAIDAGNVMISI